MSSRSWKRLKKRLSASDNKHRRASRDSDVVASRSNDKDRWTLRESVALFVLALERWLELALWFAYEDIEPEEQSARQRKRGAHQKQIAEGE